MKFLDIFARDNDEETRSAIIERERELDDERRLTRLSKREAMDRLFSAVLEDAKGSGR